MTITARQTIQAALNRITGEDAGVNAVHLAIATLRPLASGTRAPNLEILKATQAAVNHLDTFLKTGAPLHLKDAQKRLRGALLSLPAPAPTQEERTHPCGCPWGSHHFFTCPMPSVSGLHGTPTR